MWQQEKKDSAIASLALWLALATTPMAATIFLSAPTLAKPATDAPTFPLPQTVANGTTVRIDGSSNLATINQGLKENFENQFSGTKVEILANGTDAALEALRDGKIDIAAIPRELTREEQAQGFEQIRLRQEKIAIIVSTENPFKGSLTSKQFAKIFRGEITNWSELGVSGGKIRLIDQPATSDTRNTLRTHSAFKKSEFTTGATATQVGELNTAEIVKQLGKDGISYVIANQISKLPDVRILQLNQTSPTDDKYPFSQSLVYVYKQNPSPGVAAFLGFTTAQPGQRAIDIARNAEASAIAASTLQRFTTQPQATALSAVGALPAAAAQGATTPVAIASPSQTLPAVPDATNEQPFFGTLETNSTQDKNTPYWFVLPVFILLAIAGICGFLPWWFLGRRQSSAEETDGVVDNSPNLGDNDDSTAENHKAAHHTNGTSYQTENTTETVNYPGSTSLSTVSSSRSETVTTNKTTAVNGYPEIISLDSGEVAWDIEAPVAVVNSPYPQLPNMPEMVSEDEDTISLPEFLQLPKETSDDVSALFPDLPDVPPTLGDGELSGDDASALFPDLPDAPPTLGDGELSGDDASALFPDLPDVPPTLGDGELSVDDASALFPDLPDAPPTLGDGELSVDDASALFPDLPDAPPTLGDGELFPEEETTAVDLELFPEEETTADPELPEVLPILNVVADKAEPTPLENIAETAPEASLPTTPTQGAEVSPLTGIDDAVEPTDLLDISVDSSIILTPRTPKWAYVAWHVSEKHKKVLRQQGGTLLAVRLYDVTDIDLSYQTPQLVQQYECEEATHDRYVAIPVGNRDYVAEVGYVAERDRWLLIARSHPVRVFNRPRADFWFVTDTELIIHGATEPNATVSLDGHDIKLKADGTFHLRIPFSDSVIDYLFTATAPNGEQTRSVRKKFSQENTES
jgi:phosphate transport system substrate-binding protein